MAPDEKTALEDPGGLQKQLLYKGGPLSSSHPPVESTDAGGELSLRFQTRQTMCLFPDLVPSGDL